jgi:hypothetical protein
MGLETLSAVMRNNGTFSSSIGGGGGEFNRRVVQAGNSVAR